MIRQALLSLVLATAAVGQNRPDWRQDRPVPRANANPTDTNNVRLVGKRFPADAIPYKADTATGERGTQAGYNLCNSTTQNQQSMCQTIVVNSIADFCLFIPPSLMPVGNAEATMVAACTQPTHGTRLIPAGALTAVQFLKAPSYIGLTGHINQELLNIPAGDYGGEVDSGGQDQRGNPIGALAYSNNLPGFEGTMSQGVVWTQFIGNSIFCMKLCTINAPDAMDLCEHVYDTIGCAQNMPAAYAPNVFESCDSEDHVPVGELVFSSTTILPATSNCVRHESAALYDGMPTGSSTSTTPSSTSTVPGTTTGSTLRPGTSSTTSGAAPSSTAPADTAMSGLGACVAFFPVIAGILGAYFV